MPRRSIDRQALKWDTDHQEYIKWNTKRERPSKESTRQFSVDVPALFFWALVVAFVLWPTAQWALRHYTTVQNS